MTKNLFSNAELRTILHRLSLKKYKTGYRYLSSEKQKRIRKKLLDMM